MSHIWHITLNTGHAVKQHRSSVSDGAVTSVSELFDGVLRGARLPVPGFNSYLFNATHSGRDLIITVWRGPWERRAPIVTIAVGLRSRSAPQLWRIMHGQSTVPLKTKLDELPRVPWVADRLEFGAAMNTDALEWTGDFSRCVAWAWMEYTEARRDD
jgi:hypothetical protein